MTRKLLLLACIFGAFAVALGAFGAHILGKLLEPAQVQIYETGIRYQFYHTFALIAAAILSRYVSRRWTNIAGWLFVAGIICFSGSLYLISLSEVLSLGAMLPILRPITPLGGLLLVIGWIALFRAVFDYRSRGSSHSK